MTAFVSINRAAKLLGLDPKTVKKRVEDGSLRSYRVGRTIRIPSSEIARLLVQAGQMRIESR